jgi:hypothetical protein
VEEDLRTARGTVVTAVLVVLLLACFLFFDLVGEVRVDGGGTEV